MNLIYFFLQISFFLPAVVLSSFSCPGSDLRCLDSFFNSSALGAFLGDDGTVIFQNGLLKNTSACPAMSVIFARGTLEPGMFLTFTFLFIIHSRSSPKDLRLTTPKGNVGILIGPPFFAAIAEYMNGTSQLAIQGVDYPADIPGFQAGGSVLGAFVMFVFLFFPFTLALTPLQGSTCKPNPLPLSLHPAPPLRVLPRRPSSTSRCRRLARKHNLQNLQRCALRRPEEWDCGSGRGCEESYDVLSS
jgi:hypothetical protein